MAEPSVTGFESIAEIGARLRSGAVTARQLAEALLERIDRFNPGLNAYLTVTADLARAGAAQADADFAAGRDRGPLQGVPVAVKDLIDAAGARTTYGSALYRDHRPERDAQVVARLRAAGAVILGKTNLDELAYGVASLNPFFGPVRNPWAPERDAGGSSGGSAAAAAAGLAYAAIGTDTGCSIRQPAHCCGIVGLKPTYGLVGTSGVMPLAWSQDHVGPMTRSVADAALVLDVIAGPDPDDLFAAPPEAPAAGPYALAEAGAGPGLRLGIPRRHFFEGAAEVLEVIEAALQRLSAQGAELVPLDAPEAATAYAAAQFGAVEASAVHRAALTANPFGFSPEARAKLAWGLGAPAVEYAEAQRFRRRFTRDMAALMEAGDGAGPVDALAAPTATAAAALITARPEDYERHALKNCSVFNFTGQPALSLPCGRTASGLPVGLMLVGRRFRDGALLRTAAWAEAALGDPEAPLHPPGF